ncbi:ABC transporter permease [Angustibacter luteus]|uniref:ABC transporter permease n=1 Tax=Angustibacter luteus TaxID=658456 RepID=A0ABW1JFX3_9ACTN
MSFSGRGRWALRLAMALGLAFIYVPLAVVVINSFNASTVFAWPPRSYTTHWWTSVWGNPGVRDAIWTSVRIGLIATGIAMVLGAMMAFALSRYSFFGRQTLSLLVILPIALPGIVTALALRTAFRTILQVELSIWSVVVAHATFCIVVIYNNVIARLRRLGTSLEEASMDLGADTFTTFARITFPNLRGAFFAGGLLAFGLSFDEIVVTLFTAPPGVTTLPIWIFQNLSRPNQAPVVNVVAAALVILSIVPIYISQRLSGESTAGGRI